MSDAQATKQTTISATLGIATPPFVVSSDYVDYPQGTAGTKGGQLAFRMLCNSTTNIKLQAEIIAPDKNADSFILQVDGEKEQAWHTGTKSDWGWSRTSPSVSVQEGSHEVVLKAREDGIKIKSLKLDAGSDSCALQAK